LTVSISSINYFEQSEQNKGSHDNLENTATTKIEGGVATLSYISESSDSATKILLALVDGLQIETVIIPWTGQRYTLCVSSQLGCRQECRFCATGKMGKLRNLTSAVYFFYGRGHD
jgi:adenine C2-methylase RlmN of 23S rRNA A2503 and tRNA A37